MIAMNSPRVWSIVLLLLFGCTSAPRPQAVAPAEPASEQSSAISPNVSEAATTSRTATTPAAAPETEATVSQANNSQTVPVPAADPSVVQRDYAPTTALPQTGTMTVRRDIRSLDLSRLIAECPADSGPYAFAESTHYTVQICSAEYDPWQPKYYIGQAKDGSGELRITSTNPEEARQLIFRNQGYTYILYRDGARSEQSNAYLEIYDPSGNGSAEALLYLYEATQ